MELLAATCPMVIQSEHGLCYHSNGHGQNPKVLAIIIHTIHNLINVHYHHSTPSPHITTHPTGPAPLKDTAWVFRAARIARERRMEHFLGQKGLPMYASLDNFSYENMNLPDVMHNLQRLFIYIMDTLVGPNSEGYVNKGVEADRLARKNAKQWGLRPDIWLDRPVYLASKYVDVLRACDPDDIRRAPRRWCEKWWKTCGKKIPNGTRIAELRGQVLKWHQKLCGGHKIVISVRGYTPFAVASYQRSHRGTCCL